MTDLQLMDVFTARAQTQQGRAWRAIKCILLVCFTLCPSLALATDTNPFINYDEKKGYHVSIEVESAKVILGERHPDYLNHIKHLGDPAEKLLNDAFVAYYPQFKDAKKREGRFITMYSQWRYDIVTWRYPAMSYCFAHAQLNRAVREAAEKNVFIGRMRPPKSISFEEERATRLWSERDNALRHLVYLASGGHRPAFAPVIEAF